MKAIVVTGALLALTAAGIFAWKATLPRETWQFGVMDRYSAPVIGSLPPSGDPTRRKNLFRSSIIEALPRVHPPEREGDELLTLQVMSLVERRRWTWAWPPLAWADPVVAMDRVNLYHRSSSPEGWQAGYCPPESKDVLSRDQAIERLLELMELSLQERVARR